MVVSEPTRPPLDEPSDGSGATASQRAQAQAVGGLGAPERLAGSTRAHGDTRVIKAIVLLLLALFVLRLVVGAVRDRRDPPPRSSRDVRHPRT